MKAIDTQEKIHSHNGDTIATIGEVLILALENSFCQTHQEAVRQVFLSDKVSAASKNGGALQLEEAEFDRIKKVIEAFTPRLQPRVVIALEKALAEPGPA